MAKLNPMVNMEMTDDEKLDSVMPIPSDDKPEYPWGLRICLTDAELEKLDLDTSEAFVGGIVHLHALARITCVSANSSENGASSRIELQIEDMCIESEDAENADS